MSERARETLVEHLGGDAVLIPNGVRVRAVRAATARCPAGRATGGGLGFLGRIDEPRKGLPVLLEALPAIVAKHPGVRLLVAGPGDVDEVREHARRAQLRDRVAFLGLVSDEDKAAMLRSVDVYVAPNTGGESFGDHPAGGDGRRHRRCWPATSTRSGRVLDDGKAGRLFRVGRRADLAEQADRLLADAGARDDLAAARRRGRQVRLGRTSPAGPGRLRDGDLVRAEGARGLARAGVGRFTRLKDDDDDVAGGWSLVGAGLVLGLYLRGLAGRLDRLHVRVDAARDALDAQLVRRTAAALELAHAGLLDPATSVLLAEEAYGAQTADADASGRARRAS